MGFLYGNVVGVGQSVSLFPAIQLSLAPFTGNVICTMRREQSIYMEGIWGVPEEEEDVNMSSVHDEEVPAKSVRADVDMEGVLDNGVVPVDPPVAGPKLGGGTMAETVLPSDVVTPDVSGGSLACPRPRLVYRACRMIVS